MFRDWGDYFFMLGSSAAALIGLMFVVVTLTAGRNREDTEHGKHLYTSPVVWHLGIVLLISAGAIAPTISNHVFGIVSGAIALLGFGSGVRSAIGISRTRISGDENFLFDFSWYGIVPAAVYVGLGMASLAVFQGRWWGADAIAAAIMALLLVSIHAEWDLVTFLAPLADAPADKTTDRRKD